MRGSESGFLFSHDVHMHVGLGSYLGMLITHRIVAIHLLTYS